MKYDSRNSCNAIIETKSNMLIYGCKKTVIPNSVTSIGGSAFEGCSGLTSITIPNSVTSIGDWAFLNCSGLTNITIGNSVTSIGYRVFEGCSGLTSVTIGNSVTSIGEYAFRNCTGLREVNFNATNCTTMGSNGSPVFSGCNSLTTLNIGDNVQSIPSNAFSSCTALTSVTIGNSLSSIGQKAFYGCNRIQFIYSKNAVPPTCASKSTFANDIYQYAYLYVPTKSLSQYKTAYEWRNFVNIIGQDFEDEDSPYQMEVVLKNGTSTTYDLNDVREVNIIRKLLVSAKS